MPEQSEYMTAAEVARLLRISERKLQRMRADGTGPPFARVGKSPRYKRSEVEAWMKRKP